MKFTLATVLLAAVVGSGLGTPVEEFRRHVAAVSATSANSNAITDKTKKISEFSRPALEAILTGRAATDLNEAIKLLKEIQKQEPAFGKPVERATATIDTINKALSNVFNAYKSNGTVPSGGYKGRALTIVTKLWEAKAKGVLGQNACNYVHGNADTGQADENSLTTLRRWPLLPKRLAGQDKSPDLGINMFGKACPVCRTMFREKYGEEVEDDLRLAAVTWSKIFIPGFPHSWDDLADLNASLVVLRESHLVSDFFHMSHLVYTSFGPTLQFCRPCVGELTLPLTPSFELQ
ncbi:hypothetical protein HIM_07438 [Hirsutella minnesotensis 3608]|uniref:Uncharacterized protein n=1 Tax=Hirsutella minnesotensis 3608 TaxID=1043627 RepID=A0A0F7ZHY3_9HYPO|nr:hypothetical protein HIM_07438 [Hirsutella minnesotensis 3608]